MKDEEREKFHFGQIVTLGPLKSHPFHSHFFLSLSLWFSLIWKRKEREEEGEKKRDKRESLLSCNSNTIRSV